MGGFEMHQFRTIDRQLNRAERDEIDSWSSRHSSNANGVDYVYHYGSFKKDEKSAMVSYFDAMLYFDGYGTRRLMFRFPKSAVDYQALAKYRCGEEYTFDLEMLKKGDYILMNIHYSDEEGGDWMDEDDYPIANFLPLRREILEGDYRSLFIVWLAIQQQTETYIGDDENDDLDDDYIPVKPSIPPRLKYLTTAQKELIDFFGIEKSLIEEAAKNSPSVAAKGIDFKELIQKLSAAEKDRFLYDLVLEKPQLGAQLRLRLRDL